ALGHRLVSEIETHHPGLFFAQYILCGGPNLGFDASAADRSKHRSIVSNEHFSRLETGYGTADLDNGSESSFAPCLPQTLDLIEEVNFHKPLSLTYLLTLLARLP